VDHLVRRLVETQTRVPVANGAITANKIALRHV
jgi:hypothetical protein